MKATLEFDLIEDKEKFQCVMDTINDKVPDYKIEELYLDVFRPMIKYGNLTNSQGLIVELTPGEIDFVEHIWEKVRDFFNKED